LRRRICSNPENGLLSINKSQGKPKMKCSICKQEGHNKRSCKKIPTPVSAPKTDVNVPPPERIEMKWNHWTEKSQNIHFKSNTNGVGDGEEKVAHEVGCNILGQNSSHDMKLMINGIPTECDVKKLDRQNDFNTGVKGRNALRPIKIQLSLLFESLCLLSESKIFTSEENEMLKFFIDVSPDELATGTLKKLNAVCQMLKIKRKSIIESLPVVQPFTDSSGPVSMTLDVYYMLSEKMGKVFPVEYSSYLSTLQILKHLDNVYIKGLNNITEDLDNLINFLKDITLIIVDEKKGYMFISDTSRVRFLRVTRGHPRFQIIF